MHLSLSQKEDDRRQRVTLTFTLADPGYYLLGVTQGTVGVYLQTVHSSIAQKVRAATWKRVKVTH